MSDAEGNGHAGGTGPDGRDRSWALPAAGAVTALENAGLIGALLLLRGVPPLVPLFLAAKFPFCVGLVQRRHGAFLFLTLWEATVLAIAVLNPAIDLVPRLLVMATAAGALTLLGLAIPLFPEVELPRRLHGEPGSPEGGAR